MPENLVQHLDLLFLGDVGPDLEPPKELVQELVFDFSVGNVQGLVVLVYVEDHVLFFKHALDDLAPLLVDFVVELLVKAFPLGLVLRVDHEQEHPLADYL